MLATIRSKLCGNSNPSIGLIQNIRILRFKQKVPIRVESEQFILKTAANSFEVRQALELRHEIFFREMQGKELNSQIDFDALDMLCDHLLIIDKASGQVVGTYRLISSLFSKRFYSQGEFNIDAVLAEEGAKMEMGRACIRKEFRSGAVLNLLWRGIVEFMKKTDAKWIFGCASVQTTDPAEAAAIYEYLKQNDQVRTERGVQPTKKYRISFPDTVKPLAVEEAAKQIPPLFYSYLKAGAKTEGLPACDTDFSCFDFFLLLKVADFTKIFRRRYDIE